MPIGDSVVGSVASAGGIADNAIVGVPDDAFDDAVDNTVIDTASPCLPCFPRITQAVVIAILLSAEWAIFSCHSCGPVVCTEVPVASTATVTGMSVTSNS